MLGSALYPWAVSLILIQISILRLAQSKIFLKLFITSAAYFPSVPLRVSMFAWIVSYYSTQTNWNLQSSLNHIYIKREKNPPVSSICGPGNFTWHLPTDLIADVVGLSHHHGHCTLVHPLFLYRSPILGDFVCAYMFSFVLYSCNSSCILTEQFFPLQSLSNSASTPGRFLKLFLLLHSLKAIPENITNADHITWWCKLYEVREVTSYSFT